MKKNMCVYIYLYIMYIYPYVCTCIFVNPSLHTLFNHFYCLLHKKLSICGSVSESVYLAVHPKWRVHQWCTILSSHKPHLPRKAKCACIVRKLIAGKQSIYINQSVKQLFERAVYITSVSAGSFLLHLLLAHSANPHSACFWKLLFFWKANLFLHSFSSPFPAYSKPFSCFPNCCLLWVSESVKLESSVQVGAGC